MKFDRITDADLQGKGVVGQPNNPGLSTIEMQRSVEQIPREVIVPAFNRLAGQLEAASAAESLGAQVPQGLPAETPATVQGALEALHTSAQEGLSGAAGALAAHTGRTDNPHAVTAAQTGAYAKEESDARLSAALAAHTGRADNPHAVTAAQTGAYTREETDAAISQRVTDIGAGDMTRAVYDPDDLGMDATMQLYAHTKSGTVHNFAGSGANGRAKLTADVAAGDTFTVNGTPVSAYMGAESAADAMAGGGWSGRWVSFVRDGSTLNFKGGGGRVTVSGLSAGAVKAGVTVAVKQGAKTVQTVTGTFTSDANATAAQILPGKTAYVNGQKITGTATSDANAAAAQILSGRTAYVNGQKVTGTMQDQSLSMHQIGYFSPDSSKGAFGLLDPANIWVVPGVGYWGTFDFSRERMVISGPELAGAAGLTPEKLVSGATVLGVTGTWKPKAAVCVGAVGNGTAVITHINAVDSFVVLSGNTIVVQEAGRYLVRGYGTVTTEHNEWSAAGNRKVTFNQSGQVGYVGFTWTDARYGYMSWEGILSPGDTIYAEWYAYLANNAAFPSVALCIVKIS